MDPEQVEWLAKLAARVIAGGVRVTRIEIGMTTGGLGVVISVGDLHWCVVVDAARWDISGWPTNVNGRELMLEAEAKKAIAEMAKGAKA